MAYAAGELSTASRTVFFTPFTLLVIITVEGEIPGAAVHPDYPQLAETKGPNPIEFENGYVAFEDLPERQRHLPGEEEDFDDDEDEDFDDEEEEEEADEDGEEIYDENE